MKRFFKNLVKVSIPVIIGLLLVAVYNYVYDPYGMLRQRSASDLFQPNQHALKLVYVCKQPFKYDSFLFGSSRIGNIDVSQIKDGNRWYNMTYSMGVPSDHLQDLQYMLEKQVPIKKVAIAIDNYSITYNYRNQTSEPLRKWYFNEPSIFNFEYLFLNPSIERHKKMLEDKKNGRYLDFQIDKNAGVVKEIGINEYIDKYPIIHLENVKMIPDGKGSINWFQSNKNYTDDVPFNDCKEAINEIIKLCKVNNIELLFFVNPMSVNYYVQDDLNKLFYMMKEIVNQDVLLYDFSGINAVTRNPRNYRDISHQNLEISNQMLGKMFGGTFSFGVKVDKSNIDSLIDNKKNEYLNFIE